MVEWLPRMHKALGSVSEQGVVVIIPALGNWLQEILEFEVIVNYVRSAGPAWDTQEPVLKKLSVASLHLILWSASTTFHKNICRQEKESLKI